MPGQQDEVCLPGENEEETVVEVLDRSVAESSKRRREDSDSEPDAELILASSKGNSTIIYVIFLKHTVVNISS